MGGGKLNKVQKKRKRKTRKTDKDRCQLRMKVKPVEREEVQ